VGECIVAVGGCIVLVAGSNRIGLTAKEGRHEGRKMVIRQLLAMKRSAARPQDLADIAELLTLNPDEGS
jgi:hypothetical protein